MYACFIYIHVYMFSRHIRFGSRTLEEKSYDSMATDGCINICMCNLQFFFHGLVYVPLNSRCDQMFFFRCCCFLFVQAGLAVCSIRCVTVCLLIHNTRLAVTYIEWSERLLFGMGSDTHTHIKRWVRVLYVVDIYEVT